MKFQKSIPNFLKKVAKALEIAGAGVEFIDVEEHHTTDDYGSPRRRPPMYSLAGSHDDDKEFMRFFGEEEEELFKQELKALENFWYERAHKPVSSWDNIHNDAARRYAEGQFSAFRLILKTLVGDEKFSLRQWIEIEGPDGVDWDWKGEEK